MYNFDLYVLKSQGKVHIYRILKIMDMDEESRENIKTDGQMTCISFDKTKPTKPRVLLLYCVVVLKIDKEDVE